MLCPRKKLWRGPARYSENGLCQRQRSRARGIDEAVNHDAGDVHTMLGVLLREHLRERAHHDPRIVQRLSSHPLAPSQRSGVVGDQERALTPRAHCRQHLFRDQEGSATRDMLSRFEHLDRDVFKQLLLGRKFTPLQVASVVNHHIRVTDSVSVRRQPEPGFARVDPLRGRVSEQLQERNQRQSIMSARGRSQALRCPSKRGSSSSMSEAIFTLLARIRWQAQFWQPPLWGAT